jgi:hypothetical protein
MSLEQRARFFDLAPAKDTPAAEFRPVLEQGMVQELPYMGNNEVLKNNIQELCRVCWLWCRDKAELKLPFANIYPTPLSSIFPELSTLSTAETLTALLVKDISVTFKVIHKRSSKSTAKTLDLHSSPAVTCQIVVTVKADAGNFELVRNLTCYLSGNPGLDKLINCTYSNEFDEGSQHILKNIYDHFYALQEKAYQEKNLFRALKDKVQISPQGLEQVELDDWRTLIHYKHQATAQIVEHIREQLGRNVTITQDEDKRTIKFIAKMSPDTQLDEQGLLGVMKEYLRSKVKGCTWTIKKVQLFITKDRSETQVQEKTIVMPKYAFSIKANIYQNLKYVATLQRDIELKAEYDPDTNVWHISELLVQTEEDLAQEEKELRDDWKQRSYIGKRAEENNLRHPFRHQLPGIKN